MFVLRVVLAGMPAAALSCLSIGSAIAQDPTPAAAPAAPATINAVLDVNSRSVRLSPLGAQVRVPDSIAISQFLNRDNYFGIAGDFGGAHNYASLDISFVNGMTCVDWAAGKSKSTKLVTAKKGAEFYDSRWYPQYKLQSNDWIVFCMDRPGGIIMIEATPMQPRSVQPTKEFTSSLADVFVPRPAQAVAAAAEAAPARTSTIDITGDIPNFVAMTGIWCAEGRQVQCDAHKSFLGYHEQCKEGSAAACSFFGRMSANSEEYGISAKYYSRACELGDSDACKKAKQSQSKVK